jgi:hypothetical protein
MIVESVLTFLKRDAYDFTGNDGSRVQGEYCDVYDGEASQTARVTFAPDLDASKLPTVAGQNFRAKLSIRANRDGVLKLRLLAAAPATA